MDYLIHIVIIVALYSLLALSMNMVMGYAGLLSMMQAVFYGIGAYAIGILCNGDAPYLSFGAALGVGILVNALVALGVALLSERLRDLYFGLATLALQVIFYAVIYNWTDLTSGPFGIRAINSPIILGWKMDSTEAYLGMSLVALSLALLFFYWFEQTPFCRMMKSVRDDTLAVVALGKRPLPYKQASLVIGAFWATLAGGLYAGYITYIDPSSFTLDESILILTILLVGGSGNILGPIMGALFYTLLPEILRALTLPDAIAANLKMIFFGTLLILVVRFKPNGFYGTYGLGR